MILFCWKSFYHANGERGGARVLTCPKSGRDGRKMPRISIGHFYLVGPHSLK